jgi:hypothetical protein
MARQAQVGIGGNRGFAKRELVDPSLRHANSTRQCGLRQLHRRQKLRLQDRTWVGIWQKLSGGRRFRLAARGYAALLSFI